MTDGREDGIEIRMLGPNDVALLTHHSDRDVFDQPVRGEWAAEFLADSRHHVAVAIADGRVIGFASGVHYIHPDKPPELWVNEVGVAAAYQGKAVGRQLLHALFACGRTLGCAQAWVLTDRSNHPAMRLYAAAGGTPAPGDTVMFEFPL